MDASSGFCAFFPHIQIIIFSPGLFFFNDASFCLFASYPFHRLVQTHHERLLVQLISQRVLLASIPLIMAGMGELLAEKSGVLNLGVEA